eukprot:3043492-Pyramimonas_sp.AAC.1
MYLRPIEEADIQRDDTGQENVVRLQRELGGALNGAWIGWARKAGSREGPAWNEIHTDPRRNTRERCEEFLQAWKNAGYDAYKLVRRHHIRVDWTK